MSAEPQESPEYAAPALDKALDILELLADRDSGLSQSEIAELLGRSSSQLFRVLQRLERRGWVLRDRQSGLYELSMAMFELANRHPPLRGLISAASGPMRTLADSVLQSCNLSVLDAGRVRVIAQAETPVDFGFRVRVGADFPVDTPAGRVLRSTSPGGILRVIDAVQPGITDLVAPIVDSRGHVVAAVTVPYIATSFSEVSEELVAARLHETAAVISARRRGSKD